MRKSSHLEEGRVFLGVAGMHPILMCNSQPGDLEGERVLVGHRNLQNGRVLQSVKPDHRRLLRVERVVDRHRLRDGKLHLLRPVGRDAQNFETDIRKATTCLDHFSL